MNFKEIFYQENVGGLDLALRAISGTLAITALALDLIRPGIWQWGIAFIAIVGIYTSIMHHCSLYPFIGVNTAKK
jgi:hypothetical protein